MDLGIERSLLDAAYERGSKRGVSLSMGYYVSPDKQTIFCENPNSPEGIFVGADEGFGEMPDNYSRFDMYDARN